MVKLNRREFIRTGSAAVTADALAIGGGRNYLLATGQAAPVPRSANDRIEVALIGAGGQGQGDASDAVKVPGAKLVAVSDLYESRLTRVKERWGPDLQTTRDYREILSRPNIDAVIIATPDFWHKQAAVDAMNAGKDVYLEKPMIHLYSDGQEIIETARKTNRILQVGSQRVSSIIHKKGQELFQAGAIGQLVAVESWWDRPPFEAAATFNSTIPSDASPQTIDWDRWLGSTPKVPFNANYFFQWRKWKAYGSGVAGDLFVHLFSGLHFVTSTIGPTRAAAMGGIRYWKDGRDQPDVLLGLFDYPEGFNVSLRVNFVQGASESSGLVLVGSEGVLRIGRDSVTLVRAAKPVSPPYRVNSFSLATQQQFLAEYHQKYPASLIASTSKDTQETYSAPDDYSDGYDHMKNFCNSVRTRKPVVEDPVFGFRAAGAALLSNVSYEQGREVKWDPQQMNIVS
jgi:predicted dehydrogenase